jgi:hypothetical protein
MRVWQPKNVKMEVLGFSKTSIFFNNQHGINNKTKFNPQIITLPHMCKHAVWSRE